MTVFERWRSLRNAGSWHVSRALRFSFGVHQEKPCRQLRRVTPSQSQRIRLLNQKYPVRFEDSMAEETSLDNYAYLDILDRAWERAQAPRPQMQTHSDVGCGNFWYAAALQAFFRSRALTGFEMDAYRRYFNGHTREDYARGYVKNLAGTAFEARNYLAVQESVDLISCWFPFLSRHTILAWGLPLNLLNPEELFARIAANLAPGGRFLLINHGVAEAKIGGELCEASGLRCEWQSVEREALRLRPQPPVISYWCR